ncbi:MAG: hypothetical protein ACREBP_01135, partial [Sphingomicrobium sp.]
APIFKQWAKVALLGQPKTPFVAPSGIRWVRIDRASGKRVFGVFPTTDDPRASIIWEAFQPQTEPNRAYRRNGASVDEDGLGGPPDQPVPIRRRAARPSAAAPAAGAAPQPTQPQPAPLPNQNAT